jgi:DNA-binding MarR family transcriptional regulator
MGMGTEADPRELTPYAARVLVSLRRIMHAVAVYSRKLNAEVNLTFPQLICLAHLVREGPLTQVELVRRLNVGASTVNGIVDRLTQKGLITGERSRNDRRKLLLSATQAGRAAAAAAPPLLQDSFLQSLRRLPESEQTAIAFSLEQVADLMGNAESTDRQ